MTRIRARRANRPTHTASGTATGARPRLRVVLVALAIVLGAAWIATQTSLVPSIQSLRALTATKQPEPSPVTAPLPAPGIISSVADPRLAPLTLQSGPKNHYVKLTDEQGRDVLTVFVSAEQRIDVKVPLGTFTMSWASGHTWYGETRFQRSNQPFEFIQTDANYMGYDIDLSQRETGNQPIDTIDRTSF